MRVAVAVASPAIAIAIAIAITIAGRVIVTIVFVAIQRMHCALQAVDIIAIGQHA
jgi:hypothetical protein